MVPKNSEEAFHELAVFLFEQYKKHKQGLEAERQGTH